MKLIFCVLFVTSSLFNLKATIPKGFDSSLATELSQICATYSFLDLYGSDEEIIPAGYEKLHNSEALGLDNMYQIFRRDTAIIINFRGTTQHMISWMENFQLAMIPCTGVIYFADTVFSYRFATDSNATVHGGYALGLAFISQKLLPQLQELIQDGYQDIIITGHSQGGALTNLTRAYLENLPDSIFLKRPRITSYAFAAPMIGNKAFVEEYNERFCAKQTSFNIINPLDFVPKLPITFNDTISMFKGIQNFFTHSDSIPLSKVIAAEIYHVYKNLLMTDIKIASALVLRNISKRVGQVDLPDFADEVDFKTIGNTIEIPHIKYPRELKDSSIVKNDTLRAIFATDEEYFDDSFYEKGGISFQHEPYNYYLAMLNWFYPEKYTGLHRKRLYEVYPKHEN